MYWTGLDSRRTSLECTGLDWKLRIHEYDPGLVVGKSVAAYHPMREAMRLVLSGHVKFILLDNILKRSPSFHLIGYVLMPTLNEQQ